MPNPWLDIPADDYVGHMASPEVGQHQVLNRILRDALARVRPASLLVLGCSTGNGLEHVDPSVTSRVVGVEVNGGYVQRLMQRFPNPAFGLEVQCTDLSAYDWQGAAFDLVHAALIFEYVNWRLLLPRIVETLRPEGVLSVVVQLPSPETPPVTRTQFTALQLLESIFRFVEGDALIANATGLGVRLESRDTEQLPSAKAFEVFRFRKPTGEA